MGKTPARDTPEFWHGNHAWVSISDMHAEKKYIRHTREGITDEAITATGIKLIPKNTLLMSFKLSIGKTAITAKDLYTNEAIMAFIDKKQHEVDIDFMYHLFRALDWTIGSNKAVKGITLNKATLSDKAIELPTISKQRNTAKLFDCLDEVKRIINVLLVRYDTLVKSRFVEMFGDPITNSKELPTKKGNIFFKLSNGKAVPIKKRTQYGIPAYGGNGISWYTDDALCSKDTIVIGQ